MADSNDDADVAPRDLVQSLVRGLAVLQSFGPDRKAMTMTQVAVAAGISKPSARRFLLTLQSMGYVKRNGETFHLMPKVLDLGFAYFASLELSEIVEPHLDQLNAHVQEACSVGILDGDSVVYIARSQWQRVRSTVVARVGTRIDPAATALGRVLLASLHDSELDDFIVHHRFEQYTEHTVTDPAAFRELVAGVRSQGWALCDQELELGMRTLAAPLRDSSGMVIAGINVAANYLRVPLSRLMDEVLPLLQETARSIEAEIAAYGRAVVP